MRLRFICTHWGQESLSADGFVDKVIDAGYEGIEINLPDNPTFRLAFFQKIEAIRKDRPDFKLILQHIPQPEKESFTAFLSRGRKYQEFLSELKPDFINAHTGTDYYTFDQNCRILDTFSEVSDQTNVPVMHETHRGRFSFHAPSLLPYLEKFPDLQLVGDFSHFCTVSESLLQGQEDLLEKMYPHIGHIHARVGFEQGPQVNQPFAPEWKGHLEKFLFWWKKMIEANRIKGKTEITICPEAGPWPYMPSLPFTKEPMGNQWEINQKMKGFLISNL